MKKKIEAWITQEWVRQRILYDPATGFFTRINKNNFGKRAERPSVNGYLRVGMGRGIDVLAHRLAWFYVHGEWPPLLDHHNLNKADNRLKNLRVATKAENGVNRVFVVRASSGHLGVRAHKNGRFRATLGALEHRQHLGYFDTAEEAHAAYIAAKVARFGEFARV